MLNVLGTQKRLGEHKCEILIYSEVKWRNVVKGRRENKIYIFQEYSLRLYTL